MSYDRDALVAEATRLDARARALMATYQETRDREERVREQLIGPSVTVVVEVYRHGRPGYEELDLGSTLRDAVGPLWAALETDLGSPGGAYLGGAFTSYDELVRLYGTPETWDDERAAS